MKKAISALMAGAVMGTLLGCQVGGGTPAAPTGPLPSSAPGGSLEQDPKSPMALSMKSNAQNLLNQEFPDAGIELGDVLSFKTQVVAGTLFHLVFRYEDKSKQTGQVRVTIYQDLDGNISLESHDYSA